MVVAHLNKMGGTKSPSLVALTKEIWTWCLERHPEIRAQYLPGKQNIKADFETSTGQDDWVLNPEFFLAIDKWWGPMEVDLFATHFSTQLPHFYSWGQTQRQWQWMLFHKLGEGKLRLHTLFGALSPGPSRR